MSSRLVARLSAVLVLAGLLAAPVASATEAAGGPLVALQPLGAFDAGRLAAVQAGILELYPGVRLVLLAPVPLPDEAFYPPRRRYRAERLLDWLERSADARYAKIVGVTERDISTTKGEHPDWGIFGLGQLGGRPCVVSTFRLRAGSADERLVRERLVKVVNHELGHTFGLDHCPVAGCLLQDARGRVATVDGESGTLCAACRARISARR